MKIRKTYDVNGVTFIFSNFPHDPWCDYWDDYMFCAMQSTGKITENKMFYKGQPSTHFNAVDEIHVKFAHPVPNHCELKSFVNQMKQWLTFIN